jgi:thiosulfate dehydrogenase [quinone] large subunit
MRTRTWLSAAIRQNGWVLLPLRLFLGVTFTYAGLQKLADRWFFKHSAPSSLTSQLHAAAHTSPIGGLLGGLGHEAVLFGLLIAFGELAVGVGTLAGLWARWAAAAGMLFSLGFLLSVSWHTRPYYYGADIVFLFAWTPLLLSGPGPWSLDTWARSEATAELGLAEPARVPIHFATVQRLCGHYDVGRCRARNGGRCRIEGCPVLGNAPTGQPELNRRTFLRQAGVAGWLGGAALLSGGAAALLGRLIPPRRSKASSTAQLGPTVGPSIPAAGGTTPPPAGGTTPPSGGTTPTSTAQAASGVPGGTAIGPATDVPVGGAAQFTDPSSGDPAFVLQPKAGSFVAFDAVCTHAGCTVEFSGSSFVCPCHGARFDALTGEVLQGPARRPLPRIAIQKGGDGTLYVT